MAVLRRLPSEELPIVPSDVIMFFVEVLLVGSEIGIGLFAVGADEF